MQQMVANANTTVNGQYVFSGDQNTTQLYQLDPTSPTGVDRLAIATNTDLVQGANGIKISASLTANTIFDARNPDDSVSQNNVFNALNSLEVALQNNDTAGINTAINNLQASSTYLNNQLAFYGTAQDQVNSSLSSAQSGATQLQTQLSQLTDANQATSITQMTQAQTQLQETIDAQARLPTQTLFDALISA
jgi:flagellar hook-associated protein 3 FlgL